MRHVNIYFAFLDKQPNGREGMELHLFPAEGVSSGEILVTPSNLGESNPVIQVMDLVINLVIFEGQLRAYPNGLKGVGRLDLIQSWRSIRDKENRRKRSLYLARLFDRSSQVN